MLLKYHSWMVYTHLLATLYHFSGLTYWHSAQCQLLLFACFLLRRKSIPNGVQMQRIFLGYMEIYRRKKYVRVATRGPRGWRARLGRWARPPTSWPPWSFLDFNSKSPGSRSFQKSCSRRFHSVWTPFDIPFLRNSKTRKKTKTGTGL